MVGYPSLGVATERPRGGAFGSEDAAGAYHDDGSRDGSTRNLPPEPSEMDSGSRVWSCIGSWGLGFRLPGFGVWVRLRGVAVEVLGSPGIDSE